MDRHRWMPITGGALFLLGTALVLRHWMARDALPIASHVERPNSRAAKGAVKSPAPSSDRRIEVPTLDTNPSAPTTAAETAATSAEPPWMTCMLAGNWREIQQCLEALGPLWIDGHELGRYLAETDLRSAELAPLVYAALREWPPGEVWSEMSEVREAFAESKRATLGRDDLLGVPGKRLPWDCFESGLQARIEGDPQYAEVLASSLDPWALLQEGTGRNLITALGSPLCDHPRMKEILREGGKGAFGGGDSERDAAASLYASRAPAEERVQYVRDLMRIGVGAPVQGIGQSIAHLFATQETRSSVGNERCVVLLGELLQHPQYGRAAAGQLLSEPGNHFVPGFAPLIAEAERLTAR